MSAAPKPGDLVVWWVPQIPSTAFRVPVASAAEASKLLDVLAKYDAFQYDNGIKPDYSNAGGLVVYEDGEFVDWCDEDGNDIDSEEVRAAIAKGNPT